ncbi:hypothetical protein Ocin01_03973 [Orchesella cincta]|uniref:Uncharacterized protein n=1 Tax=Orchesella cincta TaxID=48709 RepID=A0A1D2NBV0_ORCCI|nr:hypothetical protein Ocin01_03973 [Orchesella cincta]
MTTAALRVLVDTRVVGITAAAIKNIDRDPLSPLVQKHQILRNSTTTLQVSKTACTQVVLFFENSPMIENSSTSNKIRKDRKYIISSSSTQFLDDLIQRK